MKKKQTSFTLPVMICTAMLSALAFVLMLLELPYILFPTAPYLKLDFSDIPAIFGAVVFGPVCGILVELIKNILEMLVRGIGTQMGFGNIQNFLVGCAYVIPFALLYRRMEKRGIGLSARLIASGIVGLVVMIIIGFLSNLVMAPLFFRFFLGDPMTWEAAVAASIISIPFNAIKAILLTVLMIPVITLGIKPIKKMVHSAGTL